MSALLNFARKRKLNLTGLPRNAYGPPFTRSGPPRNHDLSPVRNELECPRNSLLDLSELQGFAVARKPVHFLPGSYTTAHTFSKQHLPEKGDTSNAWVFSTHASYSRSHDGFGLAQHVLYLQRNREASRPYSTWFSRRFGAFAEVSVCDTDDRLSHAWHQVVTISDSALKRAFLDGDIKEHDAASSKEPPRSESEFFLMLQEVFEPSQSGNVALFISSDLFPNAAPTFQKFFLENCSEETRQHLLESEPAHAKESVIFPSFTEFCNQEFPDELRKFKTMLQAADLTDVHMTFPSARSIKRKIFYHHGPTNSGKTYNALQRFLQASDGIYCSPLRLLAMEVYDSANGKGVPCNLLTGQEQKDVAGSKHVSCTVEMASTQQAWKVAVIDEIQLLNDDDRGWAWTRALLGLQAEEVHLCGDPSALTVVRSMCSATGDELIEHSYDRFMPLAIDHKTYGGNFHNAQPGDCIVAFSRREIFEIKRAVQRATGKRCCVVYGALPPETRAHQAKLFNEPRSCYDILVASDAVGMGLNLNIRRVVFYTLEKFDGELTKPIPVSLVKQIAGRAGRRGSLYPEGLVTTFQSLDLPYLKSCLEQPFSESCNAGLFPTYENMQRFAVHMPNAKFSELLERFAETCRVDEFYFLCNNKYLRKVASLIDTVKTLTLEERFIFCFAPVNTRNAKLTGALLQYATLYSKKLPFPLLIRSPSVSTIIDYQLMDMEDNYQLLSLYLWLSQHLPTEFFPQREEAERLSADIAHVLGQSLEDLYD